ncbi:thiosulfate sulfurtransferase [Klebsiella michiganensis]|nr:thiosulfate sulfurtransferase [Klebsiella michiganensis]
MSTSFFVAADWLAEHIDDPEIQIIDARMAPRDRKSAILTLSIRQAIFPAPSFSISKPSLTTPARCRT